MARHFIGLSHFIDLIVQGQIIRGWCAHAIQVVLTEEDHRQTPDRGQIHRLVEFPFIQGTVAQEAEDNPVFAPVLGGKG